MSKKEKELLKINLLKQINDSENPLRYLAFRNTTLDVQKRRKLICSEYDLVICIEKNELKSSKDFHVSFWDINRIDLSDEDDVLDLSDKQALMRERCFRENICIMEDGVQIDLSRYKIVNNDYIFSLELNLDSSPDYIQFNMIDGTYKTTNFENGTEFRQYCDVHQRGGATYIPFNGNVKFKSDFLNAPWAWRLGMENMDIVSEFFKTYNPDGWFLKSFVELMEKINYQKIPTNWI